MPALVQIWNVARTRLAQISKTSWAGRTLAAMILGNVLITFHFLSPTYFLDEHVVVANDYPVHAHRVHVYRQALWQDGLPWGCDPALCAGRVIHPCQDVGARPHEVLGVLLPFVSPDKVVLTFSLFVVLAWPFVFVFGGRLLLFDWDELSWGLLILTALFWLTIPFHYMLMAGMASFIFCNVWGLFTLGLYLRFFESPTTWSYIWATSAGILLFLVHPLGPLVIVPSLIWMATVASKLTWSWRVATILSPVLIAIANLFWLIPLLLGLNTPAPPWSTEMIVEHPYWTWNEQYRFSDFVGPVIATGLGLSVLAVVAQLVRLALSRNLFASSVGLVLMLVVSLFMFLFGSNFSATRVLQPVRYSVTVLMIVSLAVGSLTFDFYRWICIPRAGSAAIQLTALLLITIAAFIYGPRLTKSEGAEEVIAFIHNRTEISDRLLVEAEGLDGSVSQLLPLYTGREVISSAFPDHPDPVQFLPQQLFGKTEESLTLEDTQLGLAHFRINWVFARSKHWRRLFRHLTDKQGEKIGAYLAFKVSPHASPLLNGTGELTASVNLIEMREIAAPEGFVVLPYRYHPAWICDPPSVVEPFKTKDLPCDLIRVRKPRRNMVLHFDSLRALESPWPSR